jgi:hypothetical protein
MASVREYAILYIRGTRTGGVVIGGGNAVLATGQHALDGPEHTSLDAYVKATLGGEEGFLDHLTVGATETIDPATGNWHAITLDANCTLTLVATETDKGNSLLIEVIQDSTGGWTLTLPAAVVNKTELEAAQDTTADATSFLVLIQRDATNWYGFWAGGSGGGATSPLTTKGDLWGFDTADARVPVGANGYLLVADSSDAQGVVWENPETTGRWEVLMSGASPADPLENGSGTDWLYVWVP